MAIVTQLHHANNLYAFSATELNQYIRVKWAKQGLQCDDDAADLDVADVAVTKLSWPTVSYDRQRILQPGKERPVNWAERRKLGEKAKREGQMSLV